jgi:selenocysteine lyase/cysteine desulfurase
MNPARRGLLGTGVAALGVALMPGRLLADVAARTPALPALDTWDSVRKQFRLSPDYLHFSSFFLASHPAPVRAAIDAMRDALDDNPFLVVERGMFEEESRNLEIKVCADIAKYVGGAANEVALTGSTTAALSLVYHGLGVGPGDEVLATTHDHYVHHEAIRLSTERNGASTRRIALFDEPQDATVDGIVGRIRAGIRPNTRVLGITWVHSASGIRLPVREITAAVAEINAGRDEAKRVLVVLDGVHAIGAVDETIAELGCDYFCAGTHKWMFAPRGTGFVWARAADWARLRPLIPTFSDNELYNAWAEERAPRGPTIAAQVTPGGFHAFEHAWAAGAAFAMHQQIGRARGAARLRERNQRCKDGLVEIPGVTLRTPRDAALSAGLCCFEVEGKSASQVAHDLLDERVIASASPYAVSYARLAAGLMNTPEEVDLALAAVRKVAAAA